MMSTFMHKNIFQFKKSKTLIAQLTCPPALVESLIIFPMLSYIFKVSSIRATALESKSSSFRDVKGCWLEHLGEIITFVEQIALAVAWPVENLS